MDIFLYYSGYFFLDDFIISYGMINLHSNNAVWKYLVSLLVIKAIVYRAWPDLWLNEMLWISCTLKSL
jgi:hypothetical protein